jgi:hypothetical protein
MNKFRVNHIVAIMIADCGKHQNISDRGDWVNHENLELGKVDLNRTDAQQNIIENRSNLKRNFRDNNVSELQDVHDAGKSLLLKH